MANTRTLWPLGLTYSLPVPINGPYDYVHCLYASPYSLPVQIMTTLWPLGLSYSLPVPASRPYDYDHCL